MFAGLGLLLLAVPIIDFIVILKVGAVIGFWPTLGLLILISIAGSILLKREGMATWLRLQATLSKGRMPTDEVTDGALILLGGALLLTPGFVTDIVGLAMLFPLTRAGAKGFFRKALGFALVKRFPGASTAAATGRKVYDARVSRTRRVGGTSPGPGQLPSEQHRPSDEDGSPDTRG